MKNIIVDLSNINSIDFNEYTQVYLVGYAKDDIKNLLEVEKKFSNVSLYLPSENFDKAYKLINSHIAGFVNNNLELLSLFKLCKRDLFNIGMILLALDDISAPDVCTQYDDYLLELDLCQKSRLLKSKKRFSVSLVRQFFYLLIINMKVAFLFVKSFFMRSVPVDKLLIDYPDNRVLSFLKNDRNSKLISLNENGGFIDLKGLKVFIGQQNKLLRLAFRYKILYQTIAKQSYHLSNAISIISQNRPKVIIGVMDSFTPADLYHDISNIYGIRFGCYSHGFSYGFRTEYIHIPFDFYFVWSEAHLKHVKNGKYIKDNCEFYTTGCPFYGDINFADLKSESVSQEYDILVIGEYYYHDYSAQPFNSIPTLKLAEVLNKYKKKYKICIRPRFQDEYYQDMFEVLGDNVVYSFPENEVTATTTIIQDIQKSKLVVSILSGGINDALLLNKPIIQANFLGIDEPKEFDKNNVVYYADTVDDLTNLIDDFFNGKLEVLDNKFNKEYYLNNGEFDVNCVTEVLDEYV